MYCVMWGNSGINIYKQNQWHIEGNIISSVDIFDRFKSNIISSVNKLNKEYSNKFYHMKHTYSLLALKGKHVRSCICKKDNTGLPMTKEILLLKLIPIS